MADLYTEIVGDYELAVNKDSTDVRIIRRVLFGEEYDKYINPQENDVWIDGGAHIGAFALRYASDVKTIHCYEPCPPNFSMVQYNIGKYECDNVILHNQALVDDDDSQIALLSMSNGKDRTSGSLLNYKTRSERYNVPVISLGMALRHTKANKVKLDIEGLEYDVLMSLAVDEMQRLDELIFEYHFNMLGDIGTGEYYFHVIDHLKKGFEEVVFPQDIKQYWNTIVYARNR